MRKLNYISIPDGLYEIKRGASRYLLELHSFKMMASLVSIEEYLEWYYSLGIYNHVEGTYLLFNDVNSTNSIYRDNERYIIKDKFHNTPMRGINWNGAIKFAKDYGGRLPTELEWEICARSGHSDYIYPWGNDEPSPIMANYGNIFGYPTKSSQYAPNEWGFYDMAGNMREWCMDRYHPHFPFSANLRNVDIASTYRTIKGGAWDKTAVALKCSFSEGKWERIGTMSLGFRVVKCAKMFTAQKI